MSYKIEKPEGAPEWFTPGIVCKVWDEGYVTIIARVVWVNKDNRRPFITAGGSRFMHAEPIESWEPKEGEIVSAWNAGWVFHKIAKYYGNSDNVAGNICTTFSIADTIYDHVARLKYPDGRIIDCACTVEELKQRTEWI